MAISNSSNNSNNRNTNAQTVMASEAKQSIVRHEERMDCFVARTPRNDVDGVFAMTGIELDSSKRELT